MRRRHLVTVLLISQLILPVALAQGDATGDLAINVVSAVDLGCSDDTLAGQADLRVTVSVDGQEQLRTVKAQDQDTPEYAAFTLVEGIGRPATVTVVVEEAEPGGFLGTGTTWETCDASPGSGTNHELTWDGDLETVVIRGDGDRPVEVHLVLGPQAPDPPTLSEETVGTDRATLSWDADPTAEVTGHRLRWAPVGDELHAAGPEAGTHTVEGLCDNTPYTFQAIRDADPWHIGSQPLEIRTENRAPEAPVVLRADPGQANLTVAWLLPTSHDLAGLELHAGPNATFHPDGSTQVATFPGRLAFQPVEATVDDPPSTATHVRVVATDTGNLTAVSEAFAIGQEPRDPGTVPVSEDEGCPGAADRIGHTAAIGQAYPDDDGPSPSPPEDSPTRPTPDQPSSPEPPGDGSEVTGGEAAGTSLWVGMIAGIAIALAMVAIVLVLTGRG